MKFGTYAEVDECYATICH